MNHEPFIDDLTAAIDGELDAARALELDAALAADPALRALEQKLRRTIEAVEALPAPTFQRSPALRRAVLAAVDEQKPTWRDWLRWPVLPLMAMAAAVALVVWQGPLAEAPVALDDELVLAQNLEVVEDLDVLGLEAPEDLEVIANLERLEAER